MSSSSSTRLDSEKSGSDLKKWRIRNRRSFRNEDDTGAEEEDDEEEEEDDEEEEEDEK